MTDEVAPDATPERLAKSSSTVSETGTRQFRDDLIVRMADKGQLYPDQTINMACRVAGERYYEDWYLSNMSPLAAIDYGKVRGGGGGGGLNLNEMQEQKRREYRKARAAMGAKYRQVVEVILLQDQDLVSAGKQATGSSVAATCRAVAVERFTAGLFMLAKHYGLLR